MTEIENYDFNFIIKSLHHMNPNLSIDMIKRDVENLIMKLLIEQIIHLEFSGRITKLDLRRLRAQQRIRERSQRYPKDKMNEITNKYKKLFRIFKMQNIQDTLNRYKTFHNLEFLGDVGNHKPKDLGSIDKTFYEYNGKRELDTANYEIIEKLEDNVNDIAKIISSEEIKDSGSKELPDDEYFNELDMYTNYYRKLDSIKRIKEKQIISKTRLDSDLLNRILDYRIKPIKESEKE